MSEIRGVSSQTYTLHTGTLRLSAEVYGAPDAPPLVLLHGFTGSAGSWGTPLLTALARARLRVIALDLHGHGRSDAPMDPAAYSMQHTQRDLFVALGKLGLVPGEAVVLGYSMGGRIALYAAFSGFFRGLVLESASPGLRTEAEQRARQVSDEALAGAIMRDGIPAFVEHWERLPLFASQARLTEAQRNALHVQRLHNRPVGLANSLRGVGTGAQPSLWQRLGELTLPTLLIVGAEDTKFSTIGSEMAGLLPNATLVMVPDAGHTVHLEQPARYEHAVRAFCRRVFAAPSAAASPSGST